MTSKRKETPDILAEILNGEVSTIAEGVPKNSPVRTAPFVSRLEDRSPAASGQPVERKTSHPVRWEYQVITLHDYHGWRPRYCNGVELANWMDGPQLHIFLAAMGDQGWELVAAAAGERLYGAGDRHQLYFKRQLKK